MIARGTGYVKGPQAASRLNAHLKYIEHRPDQRTPSERDQGAAESQEHEEPEDRRIFTKDQDEVARKDVRADIMAHADNRVAYHKIVLSPSDEEREGIEDWQEWTRGVMRDLEESKDVELTWYAVKHANTDDPHVHVVLAGRGEDEEGSMHLVRMDRADYAQIRASGREHSEVEHTHQAHEVTREFDEMWAAERSPERDRAEPER